MATQVLEISFLLLGFKKWEVVKITELEEVKGLCMLWSAVLVLIAFMVLEKHFIYTENCRAMGLERILGAVCVLAGDCGTSSREPRRFCVFNRAEKVSLNLILSLKPMQFSSRNYDHPTSLQY